MISRLHYITQEINGISHAALAEQACRGGADWIQLRVKDKSFDETLLIAEETKSVCSKYGAKLIINDHVQIAKAVQAEGVHLGKEDSSPVDARKILGINFIIGGSTNSAEDIIRLSKLPVDYLGFGPYRFTSTKENLNPVLGLQKMELIIKNCKTQGITIPLIAIGGIKSEDIRLLLNIGVHGIAVSSAINLAEDRIATTKKINLEISEVLKQKNFVNQV